MISYNYDMNYDHSNFKTEISCMISRSYDIIYDIIWRKVQDAVIAKKNFDHDTSIRVEETVIVILTLKTSISNSANDIKVHCSDIVFEVIRYRILHYCISCPI